MSMCAFRYNCIMCVQRKQPGGVWRGAVLRTGHGNPRKSFHSPAEGRWRERAGYWGKQGGVHQVKLASSINGIEKTDMTGSHVTPPPQPADRLEDHPRCGRADQSLPGWLQRGGSSRVAALLWRKGAGGEQDTGWVGSRSRGVVMWPAHFCCVAMKTTLVTHSEFYWQPDMKQYKAKTPPHK